MVEAVISGMATTPVGSFPMATSLGVQVDAALAALGDANLKPGDIDGVLCAYTRADPGQMLASDVSELLGIQPSVCFAIRAGGATAGIMVRQAEALIRTGICRHMLLITGDNRLTGVEREKAVGVGHPVFEAPYGYSVPSGYALVARRYMHEFGTTLEDLAHIAVSQRRHASRHPHAHMKALLSLDDVMKSRIIADPLRLFDCCLISDGGAALVVSASDAARDMPHAPISLLGSGQKHTHEHIVAARSLVDFGCAESAGAAFRQARMTVADIDVAEIYDPFTITVLIQLESIGFFERGEAGNAARLGELGLHGRLPCNTHGGLLSFGHSGAAGGMFHIVEAVAQLRGNVQERQVANAKTAFVHLDGGILSAHVSLILGNRQ